MKNGQTSVKVFDQENFIKNKKNIKVSTKKNIHANVLLVIT